MKYQTLLIGLTFMLNLSAQELNNNLTLKEKVKSGIKNEEPQGFNPKTTSIFLPEWRETHSFSQLDQDFFLQSRNSYSYNGDILSQDISEGYSWSTSSYSYNSRKSYITDGNWRILQFESYNNQTNDWQLSSVDSSQFNNQGDLIYKSQWYYDNTTEVWVNSDTKQWDITYSGNNWQSVTISVNNSIGNLVFFEKESYTYNNGVINQIIYEDWNGSNWTPSSKASAISWHLPNELYSSMEIEDWDGNNWIMKSKLTAEYHNDNTISWELEELWDQTNNTFVNHYLHERNIDGNLNTTLETGSDWDTTTEEWTVNWGLRFTNLYDSNDNFTEVVFENWSPIVEDWLYSLKYIYSYIDIASTNEHTKVYLNVFPNPTSDVLNIRCNESIDSISIYDTQGKLVYQIGNVNNNKKSINLENLNLTSGTFVISIKTLNGFVNQSNFIKL